MTEGLTLNPIEIVEWIGKNLHQKWAAGFWLDSYARPDFESGMTIVHDPVDKAVFVFIGSREQIDAFRKAAREITGETSAG